MSSPSSPLGNAESAPIVLAPGARPLPDYELKALLGRGGFGEVWRASGPGGFDVALKFVRTEGQAGDVERRALETVKGLRHAHLLPVFGAWERGGFLIVAMERADKSLMDRLNECQGSGQRGIPRDELLGYLRDAARGLDYLAEARLGADGKMTFLQHRDVKPQNLLLVGGTVKVADFGLIKVLKHSATHASVKLTPGYAPPELFGGRLTRWSDQYSLAVAYCFLRAGRMPFQGNAAQLLFGHLNKAPDLSMLPEIERPALARALEKSPARRWPACTAFMEEVALVQRPPSAANLTPPTPAPQSQPTQTPIAGAEDSLRPEFRATDNRARGDATLSTLHRPLPPYPNSTKALRGATRWLRLKKVPLEYWIGVAGLLLVLAVLGLAPWLLGIWRTSPLVRLGITLGMKILVAILVLGMAVIVNRGRGKKTIGSVLVLAAAIIAAGFWLFWSIRPHPIVGVWERQWSPDEVADYRRNYDHDPPSLFVEFTKDGKMVILTDPRKKLQLAREFAEYNTTGHFLVLEAEGRGETVEETVEWQIETLDDANLVLRGSSDILRSHGIFVGDPFANSTYRAGFRRHD